MKNILVVSTLIYCFIEITLSNDDDEQGRIVGGKYAYSIQNYPYVTYLKIHCNPKHSDEKYSCTCGSSIINQWFYLSAAHCVDDCSPVPKSSVVGVSGHIETNKGEQHEIEHFKMHEEYDPDITENDISLFRLKRPLVFGASVSRVSLLRNPPLHETAVLAGWGIVNREEHKETNLLKVLPDIEIIDSTTCMDILKALPSHTICARYKNYGPKLDYAAEGDSGSPLVVRGFIQVGLVSYMNEETDVSVTVYTEVSKFINWIEKHMGLMLCDEDEIVT